VKISRRAALIAGGAGVAVAGTGVAAYETATYEKPEPPSPPLTDRDGHLVWRNWSGIRYSYPAERLAPASDEELAKILKESPAPIRAVGAGHSFMPLVPTDGTLLSLDQMAGLVTVEGDEVTVRAGTRLGDLDRRSRLTAAPWRTCRTSTNNRWAAHSPPPRMARANICPPSTAR
jgi:hypothetical protein